MYIGAPFLQESPRKQHFDELVAAIRKKLSAWKAKSLSFAGHLVLVKHVIGIMPLHISLVLSIPKSICDIIERIMRISYGSLLNWEINVILCIGTRFVAKEEAGLCLRRIHEMNQAYFLRLGWNAFSFSSQWAIWFKDRYLKNGLFLSALSTVQGSNVWRTVKSKYPLLLQGLKWKPENGSSIYLWYDCWMGEQALCLLFPNQITMPESFLSVLRGDTCWMILKWLPSEVRAFLAEKTAPLTPLSSTQ